MISLLFFVKIYVGFAIEYQIPFNANVELIFYGDGI